eukprot:EC725526.1.p1 GENE.EC725526.1~~EC725526.1.p1  ORF type:complete len:222 (+),score=16.82 EC725526.1:48-668(+)
MARSTDDTEHLFKIIVIGDSGVGKSSLLNRFVDDQFSPNFIQTIGVDFKIKTMLYNQKQVRLQLWDTAGQERFKAITRAYYKGADGILIIYDVTYPPSFYHVKDWLEDIYRYSPKRACICMIGNKCDLKRSVDLPSAQEMSKSLGLPLLETSAKDSVNVEKAFEMLVQQIMDKRAREDIPQPGTREDTVNIGDRQPISTGGSKCPC